MAFDKKKKSKGKDRPADSFEMPGLKESTPEAEISEDIVFGRNAVMELLGSSRTINKILVAEGQKEGSIGAIISKAKEQGVMVQTVQRAKLNAITQGGTHQGIVAYTSPFAYSELSEILEKAKEEGKRQFYIICDEISDPHNLGSIIRTACAVGATGVIIPKRRSVGISSVVAKTSAGAVEHVPVCKVTNISQTIEYLKENNVWVYGADAGGECLYYEADLRGNVALVIGSEGSGISRLVKEKCDRIISIPLLGEINSLNASVAAAVLMYEVVRQASVK